MRRPPERGRRHEIIVFALVLLCVAIFALDSSRFYARADLTDNKLFTIAPVSQALFREFADEVHITYFVSDKLRSLTPVPGRIIDLLQEYAAYSHGKIKVLVEDPARPEVLAQVERLHIPPQQIQVIERSEQRVAQVYSGLLIEYQDRSIAIPFVFNPDTLEYSLTLTVRRIIRNSSSVVGLLIGDAGKSPERNYSMLDGQLSLSFTVRTYRPGEEIPPDVKVLVVLGGMALPRGDLQPIDHFVAEGGSVLFAVKGLEVETDRRLAAKVVGPSPLLDMISAFGVNVGREMVLDQSSRDYRLPQVVFGKVTWRVIGAYPEWVAISPQNVSASNPITRRFPGLDLLWPSDLRAVPVEGITAEALVRSSPASWLMRPPFTTDPFRIVGTRAPASSAGGYVLAYALSGRFPSYFTGRSGRPGRMIVVGDDDFASDLMQFSDSPYNALFLENAVEWLSSDSDLLAIKTRTAGDLRLNRIQDPARRGRLISAAEVINVVIVPLLVLLIGLLRWYLRSERRMAARRRTSPTRRAAS